jgi:hypothetical protein
MYQGTSHGLSATMTSRAFCFWSAALLLAVALGWVAVAVG